MTVAPSAVSAETVLVVACPQSPEDLLLTPNEALITTTSGCRSAISAMTAWRQEVHSVYSRPRPSERTTMSTGGQAALVRANNRYPLSLATVSRAGSHWSAWESPNSTIVEWPLASP